MQFPNPIVNELIIYDSATNQPIVIIGPEPSIVVQNPNNPTGKIEISTDILGDPELDFTSPDGDLYRIEADTTSLGIGFNNLAGRSAIYIVDGTGIALRASAVGAPSVLFDDTNGFIYAGFYAPFTKEDWVTATPINGWAGTVKYKLLPTGQVIWRGSLAGGTNVVGTQIVSSVAAKYRPIDVCRYETPTGDANAGGRVQMSAAGALVIARTPAVTSIWLDPVSYSTI